MTPPIAADDRIVRTPDRLWRAIVGFLAVASTDGDVLCADGPAAEIWQRLEVPATFGELCSELAAAHGIDEDQVRADVAPFVAELCSHGHLTIETNRDA